MDSEKEGESEIAMNESPQDIADNVEVETTQTPSLSNPRKARGGGMSKECWVWDQDLMLDLGDKARCLLCPGQKTLVRNTKTLRNHLERVHSDRIEDFSNREKVYQDQKKTKKAVSPQSQTSGKQMSLEAAFEKQRKQAIYGPDHPKQVESEKLLAILVAATSLSKSIVSWPEFLDFLHALNPKFKVPSRQNVSDLIVKLCEEIVKGMTELISGAEKVSICVDLWSRHGYESSFCGITAHFYDWVHENLEHVLLNLERLDYPHTAERVHACVVQSLEKWNLPLDSPKIFKVLTDGGSNMIKAFRETKQIFHLAAENQESDDQLEAEFEVLAGLEAEEPDDDDFEVLERNMEEEYSRDKRLPCIDHILANSVKNCTLNDNESAEVLTVALELIRKFRASAKATERLVRQCGRKLLLPPRTRWIYAYYALKRLCYLEPAVHELVESILQIDDLTNTQWKKVKALRDILRPFAEYVAELEGEFYVTISKVIPSLLDLKLALSDLKDGAAYFQPLIRSLINTLDRKFAFVLDPRSADYKPFYALATFLDPTLSEFLQLQPELKAAGEKEALLMMKSQKPSDEENPQEDSNGALVHTAKPSKFSRLNKALSAIKKRDSSVAKTAKSAEEEIRHYLSVIQYQSDEIENDSALSFWKSKKTEFPMLYNMAVDVLAVTATTAPVERIFSQAGLCTGAKRDRLDDINLEREVMIRVNRRLVARFLANE